MGDSPKKSARRKDKAAALSVKTSGFPTLDVDCELAVLLRALPWCYPVIDMVLCACGVSAAPILTPGGSVATPRRQLHTQMLLNLLAKAQSGGSVAAEPLSPKKEGSKKRRTSRTSRAAREYSDEEDFEEPDEYIPKKRVRGV